MIQTKENKVGEPTLLDFKNYYKIAVIKIVWYWQKAGENEIENPETYINTVT